MVSHVDLDNIAIENQIAGEDPKIIQAAKKAVDQDGREGKWIHYRLSPHIPAWAAETITTSWQCMREDLCKWLDKSACISC